jgi:predicted nucleic acid-binding protein
LNKRLYLESSCFIEIAKHEVGTHEPAREDDIWYLNSILDASLNRKVEVLTATLSIAECLATQAGESEVRPEVKNTFRKLLTSGQYLALIQDTILVADRARNLRWVHKLVFTGADSIHLASALEFRCEEFWTFDEKILKRKVELGSLGVKVILPHETLALPDEYRQGKLKLPPPSKGGREA